MPPSREAAYRLPYWHMDALIAPKVEGPLRPGRLFPYRLVATPAYSQGGTQIATTTAFSAYRSELERELGTGFATEHSYRGALAELIQSLGAAKATNEPKRSACGAPDYTIWKETGH